MNSIDSKFYSCKNPIQATIHQPLQIRTNKHRCFVFCIGHTSLTCVPGIGKKNKHLLNQSGIHDLSTLYSKYRSINNIQNFKQWLQNDIGFTSYQAKMTTCGIRSKLGEIKEINTGLTPICCPSKEKRSNNHRTGVKSENEKLAIRSPSINNSDESEISINREYKPNEISPTSTDPLDSTNQSNSFSEKNLYSNESKRSQINANVISQLSTNNDRNNFDDNHSESIEKGIHRSFSPIKDTDNIETENLTEGKKKESPSMDTDNLATDNSPIASKMSIDMLKDHSSLMISFNKDTTKQKVQRTLDKDDVLSVSKNSPNLPIQNQFPRKSILRSTHSESISRYNTDALLSAIEQQQTQDEPLTIIQSPDIDRIKTAVNRTIDSSITPKSNKIDDKSFSAIKRSYASLPLSTPAVFPTKPKLKKISDLSKSTKLSSENNLTMKSDQPMPIDSEVNTISLTSSSSISSLTKEASHEQYEELTSRPFNHKPTTLSPSSPISQGYTSDRFDSSASNLPQNKSQEEIRKTVSHILKQAVHIAQEDTQQPQIDSKSSTKVNSTEHSPIPTATSKCIPLAERYAQIKAKQLASTMESNIKNIQPLPNPMQKKSSIFDRIKQSSANTSPSHLVNQFKNDKMNIKQNTYGNSKSTQVQQESNTISFIAHPMPPSNTVEHTFDQIPSTSTTNETVEIQSSLTNPIIQNTSSISSSTAPISQITPNSPLDVQLDRSLDPKTNSKNNLPTSKEVSLDQGSKTENKFDSKLNNDHLQQQQTTLTSNDEIPINASPNLDSSTLPTPYLNNSLTKLVATEKKQQTSSTTNPPTTLSSLSTSKQSVNRLNSFINKTQSNTSNINHFAQEISTPSDSSLQHQTSILTNPTSNKKSEPISPSNLEDFNPQPNSPLELSTNKKPHSSSSLPNSTSTEQNKQPSLTNTILFNFDKKNKHNSPITPSQQINHLPLSKNRSETYELKHQISDNQELKITPNSNHQSLLSPSPPMPCNALWDNISSEKLPSQQKNQSNQNSHSSTTFFTFITRHQHLKERHALNEHILYINRTKPLNNNLNL